MSKRAKAATILRRTGLLRLLESLPSRPGLYVLNHHRIGDPVRTRFDRGVFSQTADGLHEQIAILKKRMPILCGDELEEVIAGGKQLRHMVAAITFDDGYLDNYQLAFPVLKAHGCGATFFLVTQYLGSSVVPWWDEIAYLVRNTAAKELVLQYPVSLTLTLGEDREPGILAVLRHYKRADNLDGALFLKELQEATCVSVPSVGRRFLNVDEAREMKAAGMDIGSHTCSHRILGQLPVEQQRTELRDSRSELEELLGERVRSIAYPVGSTVAFTRETEMEAKSAGYSIGYAFYGATNPTPVVNPLHVMRTSAPLDNQIFRAEMAVLSSFGRAL